MTTPVSDNPRHGWFSYAYAIVFVAGLGFFALSFVVLAIVPGRTLDKEVAARTPQDMPQYSAAELRGREVYAREGCAYCHTQQVRFVPADVGRWGAPTEAWETRYDYPQLWGTRRIGPDLARESGVRPDDWQLTHLYDPRATVKDSVMPPYPWLFAGNAGKPSAEALDLVAYLQTLGRARALSGYDEAIAEGSSTGAVTAMDGAAEPGLLPRAHPVTTQALPGIDAPPLQMPNGAADRADAVEHGQALFAANCASCHGPAGAGDGIASTSLQPRPANLGAAQFDERRLATALWNGVPGTAMPAWRDLRPRDLGDLVAFMQTLHRSDAPALADAEMLVQGAAIYEKNCASCHGATGDGQGPAGRNLARTPTNFHLKQPDVARAQEVLLHGIEGTSMPAWKTTLSSTDQAAVIAYVRSLYGTPASGTAPMQAASEK